MKIRESDDATRYKIKDTVKLILDLFQMNNIDPTIGLNSCIACMFTFMKNEGIIQKDFEIIMNRLKIEYSKDIEL